MSDFKSIVADLLMICVFSTGVAAQIHVSGQASSAIIKSGGEPSHYTVNGGRATFQWRLDLFGDALLSDDVLLRCNVRVQQDQSLTVDLLALSIQNIISDAVNIDAGQIDVPFFQIGNRRYPFQNPFIGLPLMNEHHTTIQGPRYSGLGETSSSIEFPGAEGLHLVDGGLYDIGIKAYGEIGEFEYAIALTNGMVGYSGAYAPGGLNRHHGFGKIARLGITPAAGFSAGVSYAHGPVLSQYDWPPGSADWKDPMAYPQSVFGLDVYFADGHFDLYAQALHNSFLNPGGNDLRAYGYSLESRYTIVPRFTIAARVGGLIFEKLEGARLQAGPVVYLDAWDFDATRIELAVGYRLNRGILLKTVYQRNQTHGIRSEPQDDAVAAQLVVNF